jgi:hypothetical protein
MKILRKMHFIRLQGRSVNNTLGMATHTSVSMVVTSVEYGSLTSAQQVNFNPILSGAAYACVVSGFESSSGNYLTLSFNNASDLNSVGFISDVTSATKSTLELISDYLGNAMNYKKNEGKTDYDFFPNDPDEGNCNALQGTLLDIIGGMVDGVPNDAYGFGHRLDRKLFE